MASIAPPPGVKQIIINEIEPAKKQDEPAGEFNDVDDKKGNRDLAKELQDGLKGLLTHYGTTVDKMARRYEVGRCSPAAVL